MVVALRSRYPSLKVELSHPVEFAEHYGRFFLLSLLIRLFVGQSMGRNHIQRRLCKASEVDLDTSPQI